MFGRRRRPRFDELVAEERFGVTRNGAKVFVGFMDGPACELDPEEAIRLGAWFSAEGQRAADLRQARRRRRRPGRASSSR